MALAVILIVLVLTPLSYMIISVNTSVVTDQHRITGYSLSSSIIDNLRVASQGSAAGPALPTANLAFTIGGSTCSTDLIVPLPGSGPSWPTTYTTPSTCRSGGQSYFSQTTIGTVLYDSYVAGGWCSEITSGGTTSWTNGTPTAGVPEQFFVAVGVSWQSPHAAGGMLVGQGSVAQAQALPTGEQWTVPTTAATQCPTSLTAASLPVSSS